jgi:hypothetical protein
VAGGWWLVAGGWWLVAGGWWLVAGGWWLVAGGWWLVAAGCWLVDGFSFSICLHLYTPPSQVKIHRMTKRPLEQEALMMYTQPNLKVLCVQRSLKVGGNKSVLVARLLDDGVMPPRKKAPKQAKTAAAAPCPPGVSPELFASLDTQVVAAGLQVRSFAIENEKGEGRSQTGSSNILQYLLRSV